MWAVIDPLPAAFSRHQATRQNSGEARTSASFHRLLLPRLSPPQPSQCLMINHLGETKLSDIKPWTVAHDALPLHQFSRLARMSLASNIYARAESNAPQVGFYPSLNLCFDD